MSLAFRGTPGSGLAWFPPRDASGSTAAPGVARETGGLDLLAVRPRGRELPLRGLAHFRVRRVKGGRIGFAPLWHVPATAYPPAGSVRCSLFASGGTTCLGSGGRRSGGGLTSSSELSALPQPSSIAGSRSASVSGATWST